LRIGDDARIGSLASVFDVEEVLDVLREWEASVLVYTCELLCSIEKHEMRTLWEIKEEGEVMNKP